MLSYRLLMKLLLLPSLLAGCSDSPPQREWIDRAGVEPCSQRGSSRALQADQPTAWGSPRTIAAAVQGEKTATLRWSSPRADGEQTTALRVTVEPDFTAARTLDWTTPGEAEDCESAVEMQARITLITADGSLQESFDGVLSRSGMRGSSNVTEVMADIPWSAIQGHYESPHPRPAGLRMQVRWSDSVSGALLLLLAEDRNGTPQAPSPAGAIATW